MTSMRFQGGLYDRDEMPAVNQADIADILAQGRQRFVLDTSKGTIVMKHMTKRMKDRIDIIKYLRYPKAREMEDEAAVVLPMAQTDDPDPATLERATQLAADLAPIQDIYALGCIEYPFLTDADELDQFLQSLDADELEAVRQMLTLLMRWNDPVDYTALHVAERFNVRMVTKEHIEHPTYQQWLALTGLIIAERRETERAYREAGIMQ